MFNFIHYLGLLFTYYLLQCVFYKYEKKQLLASNILAALNVYVYLYTGDIYWIRHYYIYDTTISILHKDYLIFIHHLITLYSITHYPDEPDYNNMLNILYAIKSSDLLLHHYQITKCLNFDSYYVKVYQIFTIVITLVAWVVLRIGYVLSLMPFNSRKTHIVVFALHCANIWWMTKLYALVKKIYDSIPRQ